MVSLTILILLLSSYNMVKELLQVSGKHAISFEIVFLFYC